MLAIRDAGERQENSDDTTRKQSEDSQVSHLVSKEAGWMHTRLQVQARMLVLTRVNKVTSMPTPNWDTARECGQSCGRSQTPPLTHPWLSFCSLSWMMAISFSLASRATEKPDDHRGTFTLTGAEIRPSDEGGGGSGGGKGGEEEEEEEVTHRRALKLCTTLERGSR